MLIVLTTTIALGLLIYVSIVMHKTEQTIRKYQNKLNYQYNLLTEEVIPMKKVPESFQLDEDDIKEAIEEWLNEHHNPFDEFYNFEITFNTELNRPSDGLVVKAVATKKE